MADGLISSAQLEAVLYANMRFGVFLEGPGVFGIDFITYLLAGIPAEAPAVTLHVRRKCHCTLAIALYCPATCCLLSTTVSEPELAGRLCAPAAL